MTTPRNVRKDLCVTHGIKWTVADQYVKEAMAQYGDDEEAAARAAHDMARRKSISTSSSSGSSSQDSSHHGTTAEAQRFHEC